VRLPVGQGLFEFAALRQRGIEQTAALPQGYVVRVRV